MPTYFLPLSKTIQKRLNANAGLHNFVKEAEALIQADSRSGFHACCILVDALCQQGTFTELVNYELDCLLHDTNYALEASSDTDMLVLRSTYFNLVLKIVAQPVTTRLFSQTCDLILAPLNSSGVTLTRYRQPPAPSNAIPDRTKGLICQGQERPAFGQSSYFKAGEDVFLLHSDALSPSLLVCMSSTATLTTRWEYDSATLAPVRMVAADHSVSRLQLLASLMAEMNDPLAIPALESLTTHPAHYVRWAALQAIYRLDRERGAFLLQAALTDEHEDIRTAASRSLAKLQAMNESAAA